MRGEIQSIKQDVTALDTRLAAVELEQGAMSQTIQAVQSSYTAITDQCIQLQLFLDDLENLSRRQNMPFKGCPRARPTK